ncbi:MAG: hypothetical protein DBX55_03150 [Verrucomicrobia bacterium]|nr:MAG: hypothetical protein DBX55_03150 [Verrucomicrobiota bacterium]
MKKNILKKTFDFFRRGIWETPLSQLHGARKVGLVVLRASVSTVNGIIRNRVAVQASSLSYATLLATGPILAITILFSTIFFRDKGEAFVYAKIMDAAVFVMPAMNEMMNAELPSSDGAGRGALRDLPNGGAQGFMRDSARGSMRGSERDLPRDSAEKSARDSAGGAAGNAGVAAGAGSIGGADAAANSSAASAAPARANAAGSAFAANPAGAASAEKASVGKMSAGKASAEKPSATLSDAQVAKMKINPRVMEFINKISRGGKSAGAVGVAAMLFTCLLLCINMESALNYVWNVRKGRNWIHRIVFYFAMIFFGTVGTIFGMTFFATSQWTSTIENIPFVSAYAPWIAYILGLCAMTCVLAFFYKFFPCAKVRWGPAFSGAAVVMALLLLNNKLSFLYISYIVKQQNFYGYFAIVAVAMFSLYIFWFVILAGGQISYVVQYIDFISDDEDWRMIGSRTRALFEFALYVEISRAFCETGESATLPVLSRKLKAHESLAKSALDFMLEKKLICRTEPDGDSGAVSYKPEFSPDKITVGEFLNRVGTNPADAPVRDYVIHCVPAAAEVCGAVDEFYSKGVCAKTVREVL